jgi:L-cysteine S-thiosulfotransferase
MRHVAGAVAAVWMAIAWGQARPIPAGELRSGMAFAGADVRAMQEDDAANPGLLWVERGQSLWQAPVDGRSCATCHGDAASSMRGVAARYPAHDAQADAVLDLDARIMRCRSERQKAPPLVREADDLLALSAYATYQSRGMPVAVAIDGPARAAFERGEALYRQRHGQMNIACTQCHDQNWGKLLLRETISQGHGTAFPAYRLEWQGVGSLQRRIRACLFGVRAQMPPPGAPELTDLELYLAWRAGGLPLEAPGVRR